MTISKKGGRHDIHFGSNGMACFRPSSCFGLPPASRSPEADEPSSAQTSWLCHAARLTLRLTTRSILSADILPPLSPSERIQPVDPHLGSLPAGRIGLERDVEGITRGKPISETKLQICSGPIDSHCGTIEALRCLARPLHAGRECDPIIDGKAHGGRQYQQVAAPGSIGTITVAAAEAVGPRQ